MLGKTLIILAFLLVAVDAIVFLGNGTIHEIGYIGIGAGIVGALGKTLEIKGV